MNTRKWPREWRAELDDLLEVATREKAVPERRAVLIQGIEDAEQARRPWVQYVRDEFEIEGADRLLKAYDNRKRQVAFVDSTGRLLNKPARAGIQSVNTETGEQYAERELITAMSWEQLREVRRNRVAQMRTLDDTVHMIDRLLELLVMVPESTGPQEAADVLGVSLDDWLQNGQVAS